MNDIDKLVKAIDLAPYAPAQGPGARELRAAIMAEGRDADVREPRRVRRSRPRRLVLGLAAAAALATGAVLGPGLLQDGHGVSAAYAVTKDADGIVHIEVRDFRDAAGLQKRLRDLGVPAVVDYVPAGKKCREPRATPVEKIPDGIYDVPRQIPGERDGWRMRIDTKLFTPGQTFVWTITDLPEGMGSTSTILMNDPVAPCVLVPDDRPKMKVIDSKTRLATTEGGSLAGFRVDEKTVGEVRPEIEKRGLTATYLIMGIPPGNPGGYGELRRQDTPVGDDWIVWEAEEEKGASGKVILLVTDKRYDKNPVYGGPRDSVITD
ncbi:hypothetical protein [Microtetraspora niveoalba]|uniref:hypothetical protein n=1 Tax=Microtetraspora niveoalba TaxID=46175 RepID=UPI000830D9A3|nr:hypothetical protein [Microtetraspora niveoalba]